MANPIIRLAFQQLGLSKDIASAISDILLAGFGILVAFIAMKLKLSDQKFGLLVGLGLL